MNAETPDEPEVDATPGRAPWWGPVTLAAFVALVVCGYIGTALAPRLLDSHPVALIALHARIRHLVLVLGTDIGWWSYFLVGGARLGLAYIVCHLIGRAYGDKVLDLFGRYLGVTSEAIDALEQMFDKVDWVLVPWFVGSNLVAAFTGIRRMNPRRLIVLVTIGIAGRLALYWILAQTFESQLTTVVDFITDNQRWFLIGSIALVIGTVALNLRRGQDFSR